MTQEQLLKLKELYPLNPNRRIAGMLNLSERTVAIKASNMGLRKADYVPLQLTEVDMAYIACAIDTEGAIGFFSKEHKPYIWITNTCKEWIDYIKDIIGFGYLVARKPPTARHKTAYIYFISGQRRVYPVLKTVLPHLIVKRAQAKLMIQFCESRFRQTRAGRPFSDRRIPITQEESEIANEVKRLNSRGGDKI